MANLETHIAETRTPINTHKTKVLHQSTYEVMSYNTAHQEHENPAVQFENVKYKILPRKKKKVIVLLIKSLKA